jgi:hypothetical protein
MSPFSILSKYGQVYSIWPQASIVVFGHRRRGGMKDEGGRMKDEGGIGPGDG